MTVPSQENTSVFGMFVIFAMLSWALANATLSPPMMKNEAGSNTFPVNAEFASAEDFFASAQPVRISVSNEPLYNSTKRKSESIFEMFALGMNSVMIMSPLRGPRFVLLR